ncbi:transcriptional regulatory [Fusarium beomiforme]|uniref:Transcriptional regulatory n=1 Tax=Fusarium beomiforme TaxID=44412 RepID=A0A9P5ARC2_9HYPO|nr:transcriptional regulatory [Fusarium beomiforme]
MRPVIPLRNENSNLKPPARILPPKTKKATRRWDRAGKPKSRSGCGTSGPQLMNATIEARPTCARCAKGKFECDGYPNDATRLASDDLTSGAESPSTSGTGTSPETPATSLSPTPSPESHHQAACTWPEVAFYRFPLVSNYGLTYTEQFYQHADTGNVAFSYSKSFANIVLQEAQQDEGIQNAVLGLGSLLYSGFMLSQPDTETNTVNKHRNESLQLYNASLNTFRERMQNPHQITHRWIMLITPLLIMYELLQGDFDAADGLLGGALQVLRPSLDITLIKAMGFDSFTYTSLQVVGDVAPFFSMATMNNIQADSLWDSIVFICDSDLSSVDQVPSLDGLYSEDVTQGPMVVDESQSWTVRHDRHGS